MSAQNDTRYFVGFSLFPGIGPVRFHLLYTYFGSAKAAWEAPLTELKKIRLGDTRSEEFDAFRRKTNLDEYLSQLEKLHISVLTIFDPKYPKLLKEIPDAPFLIYVRGKPAYVETSAGKREKVPINLDRTVGVVGTRKISHYGVEVTQRIVTDLVSAGCTIVSGMAYGVDAIAHKTALDAGGQTIAVLGCGVDVIAPPTNTKLYWEIVESGRGAVLSEMPLGMRPDKGLFPARNRIISGLSRGVVVTEGAQDSGALITARNAAEQGREVFAVPGPITSQMSKAPAKLIKSGAKLVESATDILDELNLSPHHHISPRPREIVVGMGTKGVSLTKHEQQIIDLLHNDRLHVDDIVRLSGLTAGEVASILTVLEIRGIMKDYGEKVYGLCN
ncbi:MAG TPA: DNA-processing protein DprA [Patescibacteria group bacterium]|nr:DNA-processing protein DprA [Patescibacteria group bacterium]